MEFLKYICEGIDMLLVMEEHLERAGTCLALTIEKSGSIATPGKQWFISP